MQIANKKNEAKLMAERRRHYNMLHSHYTIQWLENKEKSTKLDAHEHYILHMHRNHVSEGHFMLGSDIDDADYIAELDEFEKSMEAVNAKHS